MDGDWQQSKTPGHSLVARNVYVAQAARTYKTIYQAKYKEAERDHGRYWKRHMFEPVTLVSAAEDAAECIMDPRFGPNHWQFKILLYSLIESIADQSGAIFDDLIKANGDILLSSRKVKYRWRPREDGPEAEAEYALGVLFDLLLLFDRSEWGRLTWALERLVRLPGTACTVEHGVDGEMRVQEADISRLAAAS